MLPRVLPDLHLPAVKICARRVGLKKVRLLRRQAGICKGRLKKQMEKAFVVEKEDRPKVVAHPGIRHPLQRIRGIGKQVFLIQRADQKIIPDGGEESLSLRSLDDDRRKAKLPIERCVEPDGIRLVRAFEHDQPLLPRGQGRHVSEEPLEIRDLIGDLRLFGKNPPGMLHKKGKKIAVSEETGRDLTELQASVLQNQVIRAVGAGMEGPVSHIVQNILDFIFIINKIQILTPMRGIINAGLVKDPRKLGQLSVSFPRKHHRAVMRPGAIVRDKGLMKLCKGLLIGVEFRMRHRPSPFVVDSDTLTPNPYDSQSRERNLLPSAARARERGQRPGSASLYPIL